MEYFAVIGIVSGIVGLVVVGLSVLLANILPSKIPIGALIVVVINGALPLGCIAVIISEYGFYTGSDFYDRFQDFYTGYFPYIGLPAIVYGSIVGLLTYVGARLWRNKDGYSSLRIVVSILLLLLSCILLTLGLVSVNFLTAMSKG